MIYDYRCTICKTRFSVDVPMKTPIKNGKHRNTYCPSCGTKKVKKIIHRTEVIFKGAGFYSTDHKK